jgi:hypothetical protein
MPADDLENLFPNLRAEGYAITSPEDANYNCIAWAVGDTHDWWEPLPGFYWPPGVKKENSLAAYTRIFAIHGYTVCKDSMVETGFGKIAIFTDPAGIPTHVTRQLPSGKWTSKIGELEDIEHDSLQALEGEAYGAVALVMKRKSADR